MNPVLALSIGIILLIFAILLSLARIIYLNKKLRYTEESNLWYILAITDDLTGVNNRNSFNLRMLEMKENTPKESEVILLFDIDDFKNVNDTEGHLVGDDVLKKVAIILSEVFPKPKYRVFRIGGDEFSVLAEGVSEEEIIKRMILLEKTTITRGKIRLSKGYAFVKDDPDKAFKLADEMLYADKLSKIWRKNSINE